MTMMRMSSILLVVVICVSVRPGHGHDPKLLRASEEFEAVVRGKRGAIVEKDCTPEHNKERNEYMENSSCGTPKDFFQALLPDASYEQVIPGAVWVKRCLGTCFSHNCVPITKQSKSIPVRLYSAKTDKESCSTYEVEEHLTCGCCAEEGATCKP